MLNPLEEQITRAKKLAAMSKLEHPPKFKRYRAESNILSLEGAVEGFPKGFYCDPCFIRVDPSLPGAGDDMFTNVKCPDCKRRSKLETPDYAWLVECAKVDDSSGL